MSKLPILKLNDLTRDAATYNRDIVREWAKSMQRSGSVCVCDNGVCLTCVSDAFLALDNHMIGGGAFPLGWSFFSTNPPDKETRR